MMWQKIIWLSYPCILDIFHMTQSLIFIHKIGVPLFKIRMYLEFSFKWPKPIFCLIKWIAKVFCCFHKQDRHQTTVNLCKPLQSPRIYLLTVFWTSLSIASCQRQHVINWDFTPNGPETTQANLFFCNNGLRGPKEIWPTLNTSQNKSVPIQIKNQLVAKYSLFSLHFAWILDEMLLFRLELI